MISEEQIIELFPKGTPVFGPNGEKGIVQHLDRWPTTGILGLQVKWEGSGVIAFTNASVIKPASLVK